MYATLTFQLQNGIYDTILKTFLCTRYLSRNKDIRIVYTHTLYSKLELVKNQLIKGRGAPALSEARSAETGQSAWIWLISHYDQCLGHSEATIVKANIGHFTLLIKLLLLKPN